MRTPVIRALANVAPGSIPVALHMRSMCSLSNVLKHSMASAYLTVNRTGVEDVYALDAVTMRLAITDVAHAVR
jgi:hypothetical protein